MRTRIAMAIAMSGYKTNINSLCFTSRCDAVVASPSHAAKLGDLKLR
jgi:hypothetical protein